MAECSHPPGCRFCQAAISTQQMAAEAGITCRRASYWAKAGLLRPSRVDTGNTGQGGIALQWDEEELRVARLMGRLTAAGVSPRAAEQVARSTGGRFEIGPGIWVQVDAGQEPGTVTEWGVRWSYFGETTTETWSEEANARACLEETLASGTADAGTPVTLLSREIGPWKEVTDGL